MEDDRSMFGNSIAQAKMNTIDTNLSTNESSEKAFQMLLLPGLHLMILLH